MTNRFFIAAAALAVAIAPAAAFATPAEDVATVSVPYSDLNLADRAGVAALKGRVFTAANTVCGHADATSSLSVKAHNDCRNVALVGARPAVQTAIANARTPARYAMADISVTASH